MMGFVTLIFSQEGVRWALLGVYINRFTRVGRQVRPCLGAFWERDSFHLLFSSC